MSISQETAEEMYKYLLGSVEKPTLEEFQGKYCPDVSKYEGMVMVLLYYQFPQGGTLDSKELLKKEDWDIFKMNTLMVLGEVNEKHSQIEIPLGEILDEIIDDPFEIWQFISSGNRFTKDGFYLRKILDDYPERLEDTPEQLENIPEQSKNTSNSSILDDSSSSDDSGSSDDSSSDSDSDSSDDSSSDSDSDSSDDSSSDSESE